MSQVTIPALRWIWLYQIIMVGLQPLLMHTLTIAYFQTFLTMLYVVRYPQKIIAHPESWWFQNENSHRLVACKMKEMPGCWSSLMHSQLGLGDRSGGNFYPNTADVGLICHSKSWLLKSVYINNDRESVENRRDVGLVIQGYY